MCDSDDQDICRSGCLEFDCPYNESKQYDLTTLRFHADDYLLMVFKDNKPILIEQVLTREAATVAEEILRTFDIKYYLLQQVCI